MERASDNTAVKRFNSVRFGCTVALSVVLFPSAQCMGYQRFSERSLTKCGVVVVNGKLQPVVSKRQDARYDWLPNMFVGFGSRPTMVVYANSGCERAPLLQGKIALVTDGTCSYYKKVHNLRRVFQSKTWYWSDRCKPRNYPNRPLLAHL